MSPGHPEVPTQCPACAQPLTVVRVHCDACGTTVEGRFGAGGLGRLSREHRQFVEVFVRCRGKIKDVEQVLGLSYPTVIARLEQVVAALGSDDTREPAIDDTDEVLEALASGRIDATEAAARLRSKNRTRGVKR